MSREADIRARIDEIVRWADTVNLEYTEHRRLILDRVIRGVAEHFPTRTVPRAQLESDLKHVAELPGSGPDRDGLETWYREARAVVEGTPASRRSRRVPIAWAVALAAGAALAGWIAVGSDDCGPGEVTSDPALLRLEGVRLNWDLLDLNRRLIAFHGAGGRIAVEPGALRLLGARSADADVRVDVWVARGGGETSLSWQAEQGQMMARMRVDGRDVDLAGRVTLVVSGDAPLTLRLAEPGETVRRVVSADGCWSGAPWPEIVVDGDRVSAQVE